MPLGTWEVGSVSFGEGCHPYPGSLPVCLGILGKLQPAAPLSLVGNRARVFHKDRKPDPLGYALTENLWLSKTGSIRELKSLFSSS